MSNEINHMAILDKHGGRKSLIPAEVRGFYRRRRNIVQFVLIVFFMLLPWFTINGHQALLLDIANREFSIFGLKLYAYDSPLFFFILASAGFLLFFVTAVWGRAWCGWACPQTVFVDGLFRRIEILTEGKYIERRRLQAAPMSLEKFLRQSVKWFLFFVVSSVIAHSFSAYFVGADRLVEMITAPPGNHWSYFVLISFMTALILFDFGWFREQFCIIMCPYGRLQNLMMDSSSMAILYDAPRGDPKKEDVVAAKKIDPNSPLQAGDCVSCQRCVEVCPTGIDIRKGLQMDCIACTACADACDEIMDKVQKPRGLIRYANLDNTKIKILKPRSMIYLGLFFASVLFVSVQLARRAPVDVVVLRGTGAPYQQVVQNGETQTLNQFRLHIRNQRDSASTYQARVFVGSKELPLIGGQNPFPLKAAEDKILFFFVRVDGVDLSASGSAEAVLILESDTFKVEKSFPIVGPSL